MGEQLVDGFLKDYVDLGSRLKERFTQQLTTNNNLTNVNRKLIDENQNLRDKIDELGKRIKDLRYKIQEKMRIFTT